MQHRWLVFAATIFAATCALVACSERGSGSTTGATGSGGTGGEGGACPTHPQAMFMLSITAEGGFVPADTHVTVSWSAGTEPAFVLDDKETWKTLESANLVCDVDASAKPPTKLPALACEVWSLGATKIVVAAEGFTTFEETFVPPYSEHCHGPVPSLIEVKLALRKDAGE